MIVLQFPELPSDGEVRWARQECLFIDGTKLDEYIGLAADQIDFVIYGGGILRGAEIPQCTPRDGDEFHVVPFVAGRNASLILGVVGGIIGFYVAGPGGAQAGWTWGAALSGAMTGFAVGSSIGALVTPRPRQTKRGDQNLSSYAFEGITNEDHPGVAVPVVLGERTTGGVRISSYIDVEGGNSTVARPNNQRVTANVLLLVSKAPDGIEAITNVEANAQPLANFANSSHSYTLGETPEKWYDKNGNVTTRPRGFDAIRNTYQQNQELTTTPYVYTTQATFTADAMEVIIALPNGLVHTTNEGDRQNTTRIRLRYRAFGSGEAGWQNWPTASPGGNGEFAISAHQRSSFFFTTKVDGLTPGRYDIESRFVSADHTDPAKDAWKPFLFGVTERLDLLEQYPGYALLAVQAVAVEGLNGSIPNISCKCKGIKVRTWNATTGFSAPTWVGADPTKPVGRNPAWLLLAAFRDRGPSTYRPWGLGNELADTELYLPQWNAFADYCSETVTVTPEVGAPYTEPRHQIDIVLNQQRNAYEALQELASHARANIILMGNGSQWGPMIDRAESPTQLFTMGNIVQGSFSIEYRSEKTRINTYDVSFPDAQKDYETVTREVVSREEVEILGRFPKRESLQYIATTRWSEAFRNARFGLRKLAATRRIISFSAKTDSLRVRPGEIFNFQHELPGWSFGGRVRIGSTATNVILDQAVAIDGSGDIVLLANGMVLDTSKTWELRIRPHDGSAEAGEQRAAATFSTTTAPDGTKYLRVVPTTAFSQPPRADEVSRDIYAFGELNISVKPFRCVSITRDGRVNRRIIGVEYNASLYTENDPLEIITYSTLPNYGALPPAIASAIAFEHNSQRTNRSDIPTIVVQWPIPMPQAGAGFYDDAMVEVTYDDGTTYSFLDHGRFEVRWETPPQNVAMKFRVTPRSTAGKYNHAGAAISNTIISGGRVITPQNPTGVTFSQNPATQRRRTVRFPASTPPALERVFSLFLNWSFTDTVNPANTLVGFFVEIYPSGGDPNAPSLSATITNPAARIWPIEDLTIEQAATYIGAVKALYIDGFTSALVTSSGLTLDPVTGEDVLAQLVPHPNGGYTFNRTIRYVAPDGTIIIIDPTGTWISDANGQRRAPRRAVRSLLRGASSGQFVPFNSSLLDPPLVNSVSGLAITSKLHIVAEMRVGARVGLQPLYYPTRLAVDAMEMGEGGFRVAMTQADGGTSSVHRDTAPTNGWTASAVHGSPMTLVTSLDPSVDAYNTTGRAAWYDPLSVNGTWLVQRDVLWLAADMPNVEKPDGTYWYVDLVFGIIRDAVALSWNGTSASLQGSGNPPVWSGGKLRAYTNGKRWRFPYVASHQSGIPNVYLAWWMGQTFEPGANTTACAPVRVILDAFDTHGVSGSPTSWRGAIGPEDIDILLVEDN